MVTPSGYRETVHSKTTAALARADVSADTIYGTKKPGCQGPLSPVNQVIEVLAIS